MHDTPVRLIATDVDGTLLNEHGQITERSLRAIRAAQEKGIIVAISSGRFPENVYILLEDYELRCPIIGENGARIVDEELRLLAEHTMAHEAVRQILLTLEEAGSDYFLFGEHAICTKREGEAHHTELSQGLRLEALGFRYYHGRSEAWKMAQGPVHKFYVCDNVPLQPVWEKLEKIPGIGLTRSSIRNIEIMPAGFDKETGVRELAQLLNISMDNVMTLGDESNDVPMLQAVGYGVAMGNARDEIKAYANYVTDTNAREGFAKAVETLAL